jgi:hypothetical protein
MTAARPLARRALILALLAGALTVMAAAPACAAYAPHLEATLDPSTPGAASALVLTLRQAPGEGANRTEVLRYPPAFRFNPDFAVPGCPADREAASDCPESSRIGDVSADTELGSFSGPLFLTDDFRFVIFLHGFGGLVTQKVEGVFRVASDGYVETVLDGLPPVRSTFAQVRLQAGSRSLLLTPAHCGTYTLEGRFTSHDDETFVSRAPVEIGGCRATPAVTQLRARAASGRIALSWVLASGGEGAAVDLDRRVATRPWVRWRRVRSLAASASSGSNRAVLAGPGGRRLTPGRYRVTLTTRAAGGAPGDSRRTEVSLRP